MMLKELINNIRILFSESRKLSRKDINGHEIKGYFNLNGIRIICLSVSVAVIVLKGGGFSQGFLDFITSYLSILIGLFITALIFSFDKFYEPKDEGGRKEIDGNVKLRIWDVQAYNYTKKFAFITSQTIVVSILVLLLVATESLFPKLSSYDISKVNMVKSFDAVNFSSLTLFLKTIMISIERLLILYWLLTIMINTLYIVSSMVDYMIKKNDRNK